jgi:hypothetical protein
VRPQRRLQLGAPGRHHCYPTGPTRASAGSARTGAGSGHSSQRHHRFCRAYVAVYQSARLRIQLLFHQRGKTSRRTIGESCADETRVSVPTRVMASPRAESADRCLSVKLSTWPTLVRTQHLPLPAETARELAIPGLAGSGAHGHDHPAAGQHDGPPLPGKACHYYVRKISESPVRGDPEACASRAWQARLLTAGTLRGRM